MKSRRRNHSVLPKACKRFLYVCFVVSLNNQHNQISVRQSCDNILVPIYKCSLWRQHLLMMQGVRVKRIQITSGCPRLHPCEFRFSQIPRELWISEIKRTVCVNPGHNLSPTPFQISAKSFQQLRREGVFSVQTLDLQ